MHAAHEDRVVNLGADKRNAMVEQTSTRAARQDQDDAARAQGGDNGAFARLVERHQQAVYGYLKTRVLQSTDADDLAQEVFLRCYQGLARLDANAPVRPWLLGIARNLLREYRRQRHRQREVAWTELCLELDEMLTAEIPDEEDTLARLPVCLETLGPSARQALQWRYSDNLALATIGERMGRSEGAIKLLMFRARQALKNCLDRISGKANHD